MKECMSKLADNTKAMTMSNLMSSVPACRAAGQEMNYDLRGFMEDLVKTMRMEGFGAAADCNNINCLRSHADSFENTIINLEDSTIKSANSATIGLQECVAESRAHAMNRFNDASMMLQKCMSG